MIWFLIVLIFFVVVLIKMRSPKKSILNTCRRYIDGTRDDWNYILPTDFYSKYYKQLENGTNKDFSKMLLLPL